MPFITLYSHQWELHDTKPETIEQWQEILAAAIEEHAEDIANYTQWDEIRGYSEFSDNWEFFAPAHDECVISEDIESEPLPDCYFSQGHEIQLLVRYDSAPGYDIILSIDNQINENRFVDMVKDYHSYELEVHGLELNSWDIVRELNPTVFDEIISEEANDMAVELV